VRTFIPNGLFKPFSGQPFFDKSNYPLLRFIPCCFAGFFSDFFLGFFPDRF
jgi:hypothetical protein